MCRILLLFLVMCTPLLYAQNKNTSVDHDKIIAQLKNSPAKLLYKEYNFSSTDHWLHKEVFKVDTSHSLSDYRYEIMYRPNGSKYKSGLLHKSLEVGVWSYYNDSNEVTKKVDYKDFSVEYLDKKTDAYQIYLEVARRKGLKFLGSKLGDEFLHKYLRFNYYQSSWSNGVTSFNWFDRPLRDTAFSAGLTFKLVFSANFAPNVSFDLYYLHLNEKGEIILDDRSEKLPNCMENDQYCILKIDYEEALDSVAKYNFDYKYVDLVNRKGEYFRWKFYNPTPVNAGYVIDTIFFIDARDGNYYVELSSSYTDCDHCDEKDGTSYKDIRILEKGYKKLGYEGVYFIVPNGFYRIEEYQKKKRYERNFIFTNDTLSFFGFSDCGTYKEKELPFGYIEQHPNEREQANVRINEFNTYIENQGLQGRKWLLEIDINKKGNYDVHLVTTRKVASVGCEILNHHVKATNLNLTQLDMVLSILKTARFRRI